MGYVSGPPTWAIRPPQWATGYNIRVFEVTPGPLGGLHSNQIIVVIRLAMKLANQLDSKGTLIHQSKQPETLENDQFKDLII